MSKGKFNESQRLAILAEQDDGKNVEDICRHHQISPATFYKWNRAAGRKDLSDQQNDDRRRLKQLEQQNALLKRMYVELQIDHYILWEGYEIAKKLSAHRGAGQHNKKN